MRNCYHRTEVTEGGENFAIDPHGMEWHEKPSTHTGPSLSDHIARPTKQFKYANHDRMEYRLGWKSTALNINFGERNDTTT